MDNHLEKHSKSKSNLNLGDCYSIPPDPGMVETSIAIAGIAAAIATFIPNINLAPESLRKPLAVLASFLAIISSYGALWMLACYCGYECSTVGIIEILRLLSHPEGKFYWLMSIAMLIILFISVILLIIIKSYV